MRNLAEYPITVDDCREVLARSSTRVDDAGIGGVEQVVFSCLLMYILSRKKDLEHFLSSYMR